jgi:CheY-like chemotaxis protein
MNKGTHILLVEDTPADIRLAKEALKATGIAHTLDVVTDGVQAMDYLRNSKNFKKHARPDVILLDLNLPKMNGHQILAELQNDDQLKEIPVILLTVSEDANDIEKALDLKMNYYLHKPITAAILKTVLGAIDKLWNSNTVSISTEVFDGFDSKSELVHYILAGNPNTPPDVLVELAGHPSERIRSHVAENASTPVNTLETLARDLSVEVRMSVAYNRKTPAPILEQLSTDDSLDVLFRIASASYTPARLLEKLATSQNPYVASRAKKTLATIAAPVKS